MWDSSSQARHVGWVARIKAYYYRIQEVSKHVMSYVIDSDLAQFLLANSHFNELSRPFVSKLATTNGRLLLYQQEKNLIYY